MLKRKTYNVIEGQNTIYDPALAFRVIHRVTRSDKVYYRKFIDTASDDILDDLQYGYSASSGYISFKVNFNQGEKVNVVYEI